jgi:OmpA-OmpF porin, OOP family
MAVGRLDLTVLSSALFCFGAICATPSQAMPRSPWYMAAFDRFLRVVQNDGPASDTLPKEAQKIDQPYVSRVTKEDGAIVLKGQVPSESDVKILQGVAAATSPGASVTDKSRVDAAVPDHDNWLAAMTFALRQLGKLEHGTALLRNSSITIEGVTKSGDDFATVQKKLRDEAPKGVSLNAALKPHDVHPFVWVARLQSGSITMSGHVPDQQDQVLCGYAQNIFKNIKVNNNMEFAKGEPRDWLAAAKATLDMLSLLDAGNAEVSDNVIKLDGLYSSPAIVSVLKAYRERLPKGFRLETNILEAFSKTPGARAEDVNLAARAAPASLGP